MLQWRLDTGARPGHHAMSGLLKEVVVPHKRNTMRKSVKFSATSQQLPRTRGAQMRSVSHRCLQVLREDEGDQLCLQKAKLL